MLFCGNERHNDLDGRPLCGGGAEEVLGALEGRSHVIPRDFVRLLVCLKAASVDASTLIAAVWTSDLLGRTTVAIYFFGRHRTAWRSAPQDRDIGLRPAAVK